MWKSGEGIPGRENTKWNGPQTFVMQWLWGTTWGTDWPRIMTKKRVVGREARGKGLYCVGPCGPGKDFSLFTFRDILEGFEQRMAGSLWLLRRGWGKTISKGIPIIQVVWAMRIVVEMVNSRYVLNIELRGLDSESDVWCETKNSPEWHQVWDSNNYKNGVDTYWNRKDCKKSRVWRGGYLKLALGYIKLEMPIRYPSGDFK